MSQQPDNYPADRVSQLRPKARILPFERPQSELQKAVQARAQETMDNDRARSSIKRPVLWVVVSVLATVPVLLLLGALDGFLRAYYRVTEMYKNRPPVSQPAPPAPAPVSSEPGVVLLVVPEVGNSTPAPAADAQAPSGKPE